MIILKKLVFGIVFLCSYIIFLLQLSSFTNEPLQLLSPDLEILVDLCFLTLWSVITSFFFVVFVTNAQDRKIIAMVSPAILLSSFLLLPFPSNIVLCIGLSVGFLVITALLLNKLQTYITFQPNTILGSSFSYMATLLLLLASMVYFLSIQKTIQTKGFRIPDSLLDTVIQLSPVTSFTTQQVAIQGNQHISQEQLENIRQNPQLLE